MQLRGDGWTNFLNKSLANGPDTWVTTKRLLIDVPNKLSSTTVIIIK